MIDRNEVFKAMGLNPAPYDDRSLARERVVKLVTLATVVALQAPAKQAKYSVEARIPWATIDEIRAALKAAGVDYDAARRRYDKLIKEQADAL